MVDITDINETMPLERAATWLSEALAIKEFDIADLLQLVLDEKIKISIQLGQPVYAEIYTYAPNIDPKEFAERVKWYTLDSTPYSDEKKLAFKKDFGTTPLEAVNTGDKVYIPAGMRLQELSISLLDVVMESCAAEEIQSKFNLLRYGDDPFHLSADFIYPVTKPNDDDIVYVLYSRKVFTNNGGGKEEKKVPIINMHDLKEAYYIPPSPNNPNGKWVNTKQAEYVIRTSELKRYVEEVKKPPPRKTASKKTTNKQAEVIAALAALWLNSETERFRPNGRGGKGEFINPFIDEKGHVAAAAAIINALGKTPYKKSIVSKNALADYIKDGIEGIED